MTKQNQFLSLLSSTDPQTILWREWRTGPESDFAAYLFELLADTPVGQAGLIPTTGLLTITGGLVGLALGLLAGNWLAGLLVGITLGMGLGVAVITLLRRRENFTWRVWLQAMLPTKPLIHSKNSDDICSVFFITTISLASMVGVDITGYFFSGQLSNLIYVSLLILAFVSIFGYWFWQNPFEENDWIVVAGVLEWTVGTIVGVVVGSAFGLGVTQIVGFLFGFDMSVVVVGLAIGAVIGMYAGRWLGLVLLIGLLLMISLTSLNTTSNLVLVGWFSGFSLGGIIGSISLFWSKYTPGLTDKNAYHYRGLLFWWWQRPFADELETALRKYAEGLNLLKHLDGKRQYRPILEGALLNLRRTNWTERFIAWQLVVDCGSEAIPRLMTRLDDPELGPTVRWLIKSIGHETTTRLGYRAEQMINPDTFTCCGQHIVIVNEPINGCTLTHYYGCRVTGRSHELFFCPAGIIAVLDENWPDLFSYNDGQLRVNWFVRHELFDFTEVEIKQTNDEQIERLAVQVGNDTDSLRRKRYRSMRCVVHTPISDNTLRVLERTFGEVVR